MTMAKLERLIAKLCPDGVEIAILENLAEIGTGSNNTVDGLEEGLFPNYPLNKTSHLNTPLRFLPKKISRSAKGKSNPWG
jgi:hypothetical protein